MYNLRTYCQKLFFDGFVSNYLKILYFKFKFIDFGFQI